MTIVYNVNFFAGFIVSSVMYYLLCRISPIPATSDHWLEVDEDATGTNNSLVYVELESYHDDSSSGRPSEDIKGVPKTY